MKIFIYSLITVVILLVFNLNLVASSADERFEFDGNILFTAGQVEKNISHIYSLDGAARKVIQLTHKGRNCCPKWSPDGKKIAFVSARRDNHNNYEIYIMDADGKNQRRLTKAAWGGSSDPRWDSTGELIFYYSDEKEKVLSLKTGEVHVIPNKDDLQDIKSKKSINDYINKLSNIFKKKTKEELTELEKDFKKSSDDMSRARRSIFKRYPSPDGRYYALYYRLPGKIKLLDIKTNELKELKSESAGMPAWTKDGKKLGYVNGENNDHVIIFDIGANQYTEVTLTKKKEHFCRDELSWSSDSGKIAYTCGTDLIYVDSSQIYILDLETRNTKIIIKGYSPDWY
jgi:Tol biopolymer transport system component